MIGTMKATVLIVYLLFLGFSMWLKWLNIKYLKEQGQQVPPEFGRAVDIDTLRKATSYTAETSRLTVISSILRGNHNHI
jgi:hypothetical protein